MTFFNASDPRQIREAQKRAKSAQAVHDNVLLDIMRRPDGRHWMYDRLTDCHIFRGEVSLDTHLTYFQLGERNVGLHDLGDIMRVCPELFTKMMDEANDRSNLNASRGNRNNRSGRDQSDEDGRDNNGSGNDDPARFVENDYDPGFEEPTESGN